MVIERPGHGEKHSRKKELLICALLVEPTIEKAATKAGIGTTTAFRWLQDPFFQEDYRKARQQVIKQAIARLQQDTGEAVAVLSEVMTNPDNPAASRVSAAKSVIDYALKAQEIEDLSARIESLEQALEEQGGKQKACR